MVLDVAAGILLAGIISAVFSVGIWMLGEGMRSGAALAIVALGAAIGLILNQTIGFGTLASIVFILSAALQAAARP